METDHARRRGRQTGDERDGMMSEDTTTQTTMPVISGPSALDGLPDDERSLLVVDDDAPLCQRLARAMERRGFIVAPADSVAAGVAAGAAAATEHPPAFAVVDLRLSDGNGLEIVKTVRKARPGARVVMLTGYGNIATAVAAVKAGAIDYLPQPADADAV